MSNDFYKKYEEIKWKEDGISILNKIGNNLSSRFDSIKFKIVDNTSGLRIEIIQNDKLCKLWWVFDSDKLEAKIEISGRVIRNMNEVEKEIQKCGIIKESNNIRRFGNFIKSK